MSRFHDNFPQFPYSKSLWCQLMFYSRAHCRKCSKQKSVIWKGFVLQFDKFAISTIMCKASWLDRNQNNHSFSKNILTQTKAWTHWSTKKFYKLNLTGTFLSDLYYFWHLIIIKSKENLIPRRKKSCKLKGGLNPQTPQEKEKNKKVGFYRDWTHDL